MISQAFRGTVVLAGLSPFMGGRCRDRAFMSAYPGGALLADVADEAEKRGFQVVTVDQFLSSDTWTAPAMLVSDTGRGLAECCGRAVPAVCWCLESPVVANSFFHALRRHTGVFPHVFLWAGARDRVAPKANFHAITWPHDFSHVQPGPAWEARRFAVMVTANKRPFPMFWRPTTLRPLRLARWLAGLIVNAVHVTWIRSIDPWMSASLADARRGVIAAFAETEFDLYGPGWERAAGEGKMGAAIARSYRGSLAQGPASKLATIARYRFCLCFENASFPGYITEKIFDALLADTIPVYLGAPDIATYVWPDVFVDARRFRSWTALAQFLSVMPESHAATMRQQAARFIQSEDFTRFRSSSLAARIVDAVDATVQNDA